MQSPEKIEDVKTKSHARVRKVLCHGIGNFGGSRKKFSGRERRAKGRVRLLRARGSAELREVASGSATYGLGMRNGKVGFQVSGIDQSRSLGRKTVRKIRRGGRREREPAIE